MAPANEKTLFTSSFVQVAGDETSPPVEKSMLSQVHVVETTHQPSANLSQVDSNPSSLQTGSVAMPRNSDTSNRLNPFDTDIEATVSRSTSRVGEGAGARVIGDHMHDNDSRVWPGQNHWKRKAKEAKIKRSSTCLSHLSKKSRLIAKITIVVFVIGIAVAVGVGVSKPLGAGIWKPHNS